MPFRLPLTPALILLAVLIAATAIILLLVKPRQATTPALHFIAEFDKPSPLLPIPHLNACILKVFEIE